MYIADASNHCIQKFSPDGKFLCQFGTKGSGPGQLNKPTGITIDTAATGLVYVSEWGNHRISVFTSDGVFDRFGEEDSNIGQFYAPYGITFDKEGFCLFVIMVAAELLFIKLMLSLFMHYTKLTIKLYNGITWLG